MLAKKEWEKKSWMNPNLPLELLPILTAIPEGSTSLAIFMASDVAISWFAGEIAKIMQFGYTIDELN